SHEAPRDEQSVADPHREARVDPPLEGLPVDPPDGIRVPLRERGIGFDPADQPPELTEIDVAGVDRRLDPRQRGLEIRRRDARIRHDCPLEWWPQRSRGPAESAK